MSIANKKQSHTSEARPNDRDTSRASVPTNRISARSWKKVDTVNKDTRKLSREFPHVKTSVTTKYQQINQKQVSNNTPSYSASKFPWKLLNGKDVKCLNLDGIMKIQTEIKPFTDNIVKSKPAMVSKDEKDFSSNFDKKYPMHSHHPPKLMDNCYVNKPDCKYPSNLSSARSKSMKKSTSFTGQTEETNSKPDSSSNESQISAWLLQCNNASVTFGDENDRQPENKTPTEGQQINYNPQKHFNDHSRSYSTYEQKQDAGKVASVNKKELRSIFNSKNSSLNEVSENNLKSFTKQLIHSNHERLDEQNKLNDVKNNHSQSLYVKKNAKKLSDKVSDNDEFNVQMNPNNVKYYDANSTNATDWASVSSSEWGDDMCEFDRQQSFRVHEMFEEIDRILFDNLTFDSRDQTQKNNVNTSPDDKTYYSMNKSNCLNFPSYTDDCHPINIDNLRLLSSNPEETQNLPITCQYANQLGSPTPNFTNNLSGIQDHLFCECKDWLSRFPHLRVVGKRIETNEDHESTFYHHQNNDNVVSDFYKFPERSSVTVDTSMDINNDGSSDKQNDMTEIEWDKPATTVSTIVADEETFAIDGDYEKFTENSMHKSINYKPVGNAERFHKTSLYEQKYRHHNSSFEDGKNIVFKVHQETRHHRHDHHHHHHHHRCSRKQNSNCSLKRSQSNQCNKKMANSPSGITQSSSTKNIKAPEDITQHACFGSYHSAVDFKKQPPSSIEVILRLISQQLWTDLMSWLETTLSDNISANPSKSDGNAVIQKHIFHYPFPLYRLRDNTLSRCDSSVADTQNSLASPSCRLSKQAKHANVDASTFTSSQHAVQMNESNVELTDLLQISTKTLQIREKSIVNEATDNSNRIQYTGSNCLIDSISNHPQAAVSTSHSSSITMTTITTLVSRVSPQPVGTSSVTRPISSSHCKSSTNISRKSLLTFNSSMTEVPNHSGTSGVGVIGIAANLHHNGRLAPLDRIRTPLPSHYSSTLEEQIIVTTAIMPTLFANTESSLRSTYTSSLSRYRNVNVSQLSSSVTTGNTPPPPSPSAATTIVQNVSNPNTNGINQTFSTITTNTVNDSTVSRNFILPPLLNPTVNSTINTTAISLASFNPLATGLSISSPKTNFSVIHKTGFGLTQQSRQTGQHTPFLHKGNGGNLVAQQNNNSSVNTLLHIHRTTSKSSTHHNQSSPKQTSFPLPPIDASKDRLRKHKKLWRPYSSRPSIITKSITNSNLLARAYSTLLFQTPEMYGDTCSVKINPAIFIGSTTSCLRNNDSVSR